MLAGHLPFIVERNASMNVQAASNRSEVKQARKRAGKTKKKNNINKHRLIQM